MKQTSKSVYNKKTDEEILVVPREKLLPNGSFNGLQPANLSEIEKEIRQSSMFMWRSLAEVDPSHKQIIPYLVFEFENKFFLMQRKASSSEVRLKSRYSLGIGGHIRREDIENCSMADWAKREFNEEVSYSGELQITPIGLLNDESNPVGEVHTGFVFLLKGSDGNIKVRSELQNGNLLSLSECSKHYENMESWSKYVFDYLSSSQILKN